MAQPLSTVALVGSPSPIGGIYTDLPQGTKAPPHINDQGMVEFYVQVQGGYASGGIFLYHDGTTRAIALLGAAAPSGGTFINFEDRSRR